MKQLACDVHMALVEDHGTLEIAAVHAAMQLNLIDAKALERYRIMSIECFVIFAQYSLWIGHYDAYLEHGFLSRSL